MLGTPKRETQHKRNAFVTVSDVMPVNGYASTYRVYLSMAVKS